MQLERFTASSHTGVRYQPEESRPTAAVLAFGLQFAACNVAGIVLIPTIGVRAAGGTEAYLCWAVFVAVAVVGAIAVLQAVRAGRFAIGNTGRETLAGLAANDEGTRRGRLEVKLGDGFAAFGDWFAATPELGLANDAREYSLGWKLDQVQGGPAPLEIGVEATRSESAGGDVEPDHGTMLRGTTRW